MIKLGGMVIVGWNPAVLAYAECSSLQGGDHEKHSGESCHMLVWKASPCTADIFQGLEVPLIQSKQTKIV